jgi:hypothetical protein
MLPLYCYCTLPIGKPDCISGTHAKVLCSRSAECVHPAGCHHFARLRLRKERWRRTKSTSLDAALPVWAWNEPRRLFGLHSTCCKFPSSSSPVLSCLHRWIQICCLQVKKFLTQDNEQSSLFFLSAIQFAGKWASLLLPLPTWRAPECSWVGETHNLLKVQMEHLWFYQFFSPIQTLSAFLFELRRRGFCTTVAPCRYAKSVARCFRLQLTICLRRILVSPLVTAQRPSHFRLLQGIRTLDPWSIGLWSVI